MHYDSEPVLVIFKLEVCVFLLLIGLFLITPKSDHSLKWNPSRNSPNRTHRHNQCSDFISICPHFTYGFIYIYHVEKRQKSENSSVKNQNKTQDALPRPLYFYSECTFSKQKDLPLIYSWEVKQLSTPTVTSGCLRKCTNTLRLRAPHPWNQMAGSGTCGRHELKCTANSNGILWHNSSDEAYFVSS